MLGGCPHARRAQCGVLQNLPEVEPKGTKKSKVFYLDFITRGWQEWRFSAAEVEMKKVSRKTTKGCGEKPHSQECKVILSSKSN